MGVDMPLDHARTRFPLLPGEPADAHARFARGEGCLVGEPLYRKAGVRAGDRLPLTTPGGLAEVEVVGVFYDYTSDQGTVVVDLATLTRLFGPAPIGSLSLYLAPGHDADATLEELRRRLPGAPLWLRSNRTMRGEIFAIFDATFAITRILQGLALAIAALGISLALFVMAREQAAETALLRALGARRDQIFRVYAGKGLGMAAAGLALGLAGGAALALVLILVVNRDWFGWTLQIHWPVATLAGQAATVVLAGLLASFSPARRASDTPSEELTRED